MAGAGEPDEDAFVETWGRIAGLVGRSDRWCRYTAVRPIDPLPTFKVGGTVRLGVRDYRGWLARQRARGLRAAPLGRAVDEHW